jgi:large subunit ribosomal protein L21
MYAVIKTGGKQHRVAPGDQIQVELLEGEPGDKVTFEPMLVVDDAGTHVGKEVAGATVTAKLLGEQKGEKIKVFRYRPKTGYKKTTGHRQKLTLLEIEGVELKKGAAKKTPAKAETAAEDA